MPARRTKRRKPKDVTAVSLPCRHWKTLVNVCRTAAAARGVIEPFWRFDARFIQGLVEQIGKRADDAPAMVAVDPMLMALICDAALWATGKVLGARQAGHALVVAISRATFRGSRDEEEEDDGG